MDASHKKTPAYYDSTSYLLKRLLSEHIKPYLKRIIIAVLCMIIVAATTAANAWLMQPILDDIFLDKNQDMLVIISIAVIIIAFVKGAGAYGQSLIMKCVGQRIVTNMQIRLYDHLLHADLAYINTQGSGRLVSKFTNDINIMRRSVSTVLTGLAKEILTLFFLVALMFYQNVILSLIALIAFPIAVHPIIRLGKRMRKISNNTQIELGLFTEKLDETFKNIRIVKAYQGENFETSRATNVMEKIYKLYHKAARTESVASPIMETLGGLAIAAVVWYGGIQVIHGNTTPGSFFSFISALIMAYKPLKSLSGLNTALQEGLASAKRLFLVLDTKPKIISKPNAKELQISSGNIRFSSVSFNYDSKKGTLNHVTIDILPGKTTALVGASGAGKSTIINLILRFYDPDKGTITIDNQNIKEVTLTSLRDKIALVNQDILMFDDTIQANIAYGKPGISKNKIIEAAKMAAADGFIRELPQGYDTKVGQNAFTLSGGQRQRIAIARAFLKDAPILLLDEATSSLDSLSEKHIQDAITKLSKGKTTLVIAHRLSTVVNADLIYVMRKGIVIESGTHKSLLAKKGEYSKLYKHLENT